MASWITGDLRSKYASHAWTSWNHYYVTGSCSSTTTITQPYHVYGADSLWRAWNETATSYTIQTTSSTSTLSTLQRDVLWRVWNDEVDWGSYRSRQPVVSEAERARRRQAAAESREREQRARRTARQLLLSLLDDAQQAEYERDRSFTVVGSDGRTYQICQGRQHNVFVLDAHGNRIEELCGHVRDYIPDEDNMVAQKLHLEFDAPGFRQVCNIWDLLAPGRPIIHRSGEPIRERQLTAA